MMKKFSEHINEADVAKPQTQPQTQVKPVVKPTKVLQKPLVKKQEPAKPQQVKQQPEKTEVKSEQPTAQTTNTGQTSGQAQPSKPELDFTEKLKNILSNVDKNIGIAKGIKDKSKSTETKDKEAQDAQTSTVADTNLSEYIKDLSSNYIMTIDDKKATVKFEAPDKDNIYAQIVSVDKESEAIKKFEEEFKTKPYLELPIKVKFGTEYTMPMCVKSASGNSYEPKDKYNIKAKIVDIKKGRIFFFIIYSKS